MLKRLGILFSLAVSLLVTLKGELHLMIDRCRRSVKKGTLDFGNNIFHGTVDSVRAWVCPKRCHGNRPNTKMGQGTGERHPQTSAGRAENAAKPDVWCVHACKIYVHRRCNQRKKLNR